jgi:hypothetical protein
MSGGMGFALGILFAVFLMPTVLHVVEGGIGSIGGQLTGAQGYYD